MVSPHRIKYNNIFSNELNIPDLIMCVSVDSDNGEMPSFLNREAVSSESHDGRYKRIHSFKYTETFAPKFTFFKSDFGNFEMDEVRTVLKWLTLKDTTTILETYYDDSNVVSWASIGGFVDLQTYKLANNRTIAITATWDSISPFALSDLHTITKTISYASDNKITIEIDTDDNKPVYPRITINHGYGTTSTPHLVVDLPSTVTFNNIVDMADYVENTVYHNATTNTYYYKSYTPQFTTSTTLPEYVNWTTTEVNRKYTSADTFAANTFYHYAYEGIYYWKIGDTIYEEPSRPVYGDWVTKTGTKVYTASDIFEDKTIYSYNGTYYWMAPHNFYKSSTKPSLSTTSVKITNKHTDFFGKSATLQPEIVKNNTSTEKIVLDGANKIVSSDRTRRIFGDDFNLHHLELYDGKNEITIEGNCEVTLEWREARKIGEY